jgi:hypothetical protein
MSNCQIIGCETKNFMTSKRKGKIDKVKMINEACFLLYLIAVIYFWNETGKKKKLIWLSLYFFAVSLYKQIGSNLLKVTELALVKLSRLTIIF